VLNELSTTPWRRRGSGCIDPRFLDLGTSWKWVTSFTPRLRYPRGNSPLYPLGWRLGWPQSRSGQLEKRNLLILLGLELGPLHRPPRSQSLYRLSYPGSYTLPHNGKYLYVLLQLWRTIHFFHSAFARFFWVSQETAIDSININLLIFVKEVWCVFCEAGNRHSMIFIFSFGSCNEHRVFSQALDECSLQRAPALFPVRYEPSVYISLLDYPLTLLWGMHNCTGSIVERITSKLEAIILAG
jgi:hypothetical protein